MSSDFNSSFLDYCKYVSVFRHFLACLWGPVKDSDGGGVRGVGVVVGVVLVLLLALGVLLLVVVVLVAWC